nr:type II toxin-antitoxin system HicB family antitoxin [Anoxybacillus sp.]
MKKDRYIYPAIFDYDSDGICVEFPDLPGCFTCGDKEEEALQMAKEALALHL